METAALTIQRPSLITKFAARFGVDPKLMTTTLKQTCFKVSAKDGRQQEVTNEELMALLIVADQYNLNPWTREIYAFPDKKRGGIVPIVGVDGWIRIVQDRPEFNGASFAFGPEDENGRPEWIECTMFRKDREHAFPVREYLRENKRDTDTWAQMPNRMLRHRAWMQAGRLTFGFTGLYDEDDARKIIEGTVVEAEPVMTAMNRDIEGEKVEGGKTEEEEKALRERAELQANGDRMRAAMMTRAAKEDAGEPRQEAATAASGANATDEVSVEVRPAKTSPAPSYAELMARIMAAEKNKNIEDLHTVWDLVRSVADDQQRAELDVEARRVHKALGAP